MTPPLTFGELPGWEFAVEERSAGVYEVSGRHRDGRSLQMVGYDPDALIDQARQDAYHLNQALRAGGDEGR